MTAQIARMIAQIARMIAYTIRISIEMEELKWCEVLPSHLQNRIAQLFLGNASKKY